MSQIKHDKSRTSTYRTWISIKARCCNPRYSRYSDYGGRGIRVCERWCESFENFFYDMGEKPLGLSIDRIDNNGNYEPGNCRWATRKQQDSNMRKNVFLTLHGKTQILSDWARELGMTGTSLRKRLRRWPIERALSAPPAKPLRITFEGKQQTIATVAEKLGIHVSTLRSRIDNGWSVRRAVEKSSKPLLIRHDGKYQSLLTLAREHGLNVWTLRGRIEDGWTVERALKEPARRR